MKLKEFLKIGFINMILRTKGSPHNLQKFEVLKATRFLRKAYLSNYCLIIDDKDILNNSIDLELFVITTAKISDSSYEGRCLYNVKTLDHIAEDDILYIGTDGNLRTLYRVNSSQNYLLLTERCNSNCLMCSQPPKDKDDIEYINNIYLKLIPLIPKDCIELGLTGGEPTILGNKLFNLLELITKELPNTELHILTNGRAFSINALAEKLNKVNNPRIMLGIPLYSDYYQIHDYVVQTKDAYYQTIMGIYNLKRYNIRVEIRIVLHKITIPRLEKLSEYIYKNLPFVDQIAFMGLEIMGFTKINLKELWIDPVYYMKELEKSVSLLARRKLKVLIYNIPLCLLPIDIWRFSKKSISDWKNIYFDECNMCVLKEECCGMFASAERKHSEFIKAFKTDPRIKNELSKSVTC